MHAVTLPPPKTLPHFCTLLYSSHRVAYRIFIAIYNNLLSLLEGTTNSVAVVFRVVLLYHCINLIGGRNQSDHSP